MDTITIDPKVQAFVEQGRIDPSRGYHGTRGHFQVGDYILPSNEYGKQNDAHKPNYSISNQDVTYYTAITSDLPMYIDGGDSFESARRWARGRNGGDWCGYDRDVEKRYGPMVVLLVEPEGHIAFDANLVRLVGDEAIPYPVGGSSAEWDEYRARCDALPRACAELTADRLRIIEIIPV